MDDFSDDGFDELNDTTLQELENHAIQFTQAQRFDQSQSQALKDIDDYGLEEDDDLDDALVLDESANAPVRPVVERQTGSTAAPFAQDARQLPSRSFQQPRWQQQPVTGAKPPTQYSTIRNSGPTSSRYAAPGPHMPLRMGPPPLPGPDRYGAPQSTSSSSSFRPGHQHPQGPQQQGGGGAIPQSQNNLVEALQARLRALENDLNSARGEVSIVRSKYEKSISTHEAELSRLKKQNAEALAKQQRLVDAAIQNEKTAATELQFTRQDLREELQRSKKQRSESGQAGTSTPKKNKANVRNNVADGFDDVEILPSPSKAQGGAKGKGKSASFPGPGERTPSRAKRKRPAIESPVTALEVEDDVAMVDPAPPGGGAQPPGSNLRSTALPYDLLRLVLDHGAIYGQPLTFDLLARYTFPSDPDQSFAGIIFQKLPSLGDPQDPLRLLIDFCNMIIDLWDQCLKEKYYEPIFDLASLVTFILQLNTIPVAPYITSTLIPVAQTTILLLAVPRFESVNGDLSTSLDEKIPHLILNIDTEGTLQLMYLTALGCVDSYLLNPEYPLDLGPDRDSPQRLYWKMVEIDFVLAMISHKQPHDEFLRILRLLCTSCLPDSIGPITGKEARDPVFVAQALIERVSKVMHMPHLWVTPADSAGAYGHRQCLVRLEALRTLMAFAQSPFGAKQMVFSDVAIPRLVNVLCGAIDALYNMDVPVKLFQPTDDDSEGEAAEASNEMAADTLDPNPTPLLYTLISSIVLLLHALVTDPSTSAHIDMRAKLSTSHGASQKYLLALSRLNYVEEDLILEAGIDPVTCDRAADLLEVAITPVEAEGVEEVFQPAEEAFG
ncbi:hypothetical protein M406DRAFT_39213 [Cryphonectria parasitica EP155]|uniref:DNA repair protein Rad26 n=1 Tax=Cryphonectria parasitica (strain ATCC 38755 / EP155) TaxID=660469 RepID=A0A9P4Y6F9_CRYP1|nr:uncharacterized protein M406DRAFT_39213 [Cryphonectria parasitica EP155]KAF3767324.1 hypothetical protein M406DRAFT_39213 [Cryphonectria parasitica EP155]